MSTMTATSGKAAGMTKDERFVILASSLGTVFEWYDFYLYGSLASIIGAQFFSAYPPATRDIFALLAFAAGFLVRPFGAIVFGRIGDIVGRKYTFLVTILIMALGFRLSSELVAGVVVGAAIGWVFDRLLSTSPFGFIVFLLLGFVAGVVNVVRTAGAGPGRR